MREEHDSMGTLLVEDDKLWGAQTQRSLENFKIGGEKMPVEIIRAFGLLKRAAAEANAVLRSEKNDRAQAPCHPPAADEAVVGAFDAHVPLVVRQAGSGT